MDKLDFSGLEVLDFSGLEEVEDKKDDKLDFSGLDVLNFDGLEVEPEKGGSLVPGQDESDSWFGGRSITDQLMKPERTGLDDVVDASPLTTGARAAVNKVGDAILSTDVGKSIALGREDVAQGKAFLDSELGFRSVPQTAKDIAGSFERSDKLRLSPEAEAQQRAISEAEKNVAASPADIGMAIGRAGARGEAFQMPEASEGRKWLAAADVMARNPAATVNMAARSAAALPEQIAISLAGAAVGAGLAGPAGATAGMIAGTGVASGVQEYGSTLAQVMNDRGMKMTEENVARALQDADLMSAVREKGLKRGVPVAVFDALSAGLAGKFLGPVVKGVGDTVAGRTAGGLAELAAQGSLGAAGEASAQIVDQGKITSRSDILAEGLAEVPMSGHEVVFGAMNRGETARAENAAGVPQSQSIIPEGALPASALLGDEIDLSGLDVVAEEPGPAAGDRVQPAPEQAAPSAPAAARADPATDQFLEQRLASHHSAEHITGMQADLKTGIAGLIQSAPPQIAAGLGIGSGFRTVERQAELYAEAVKKYGSEAEARKWVAPPGNSQHNHGNAADLTFNGQRLDKAPPEVIEWVHANAGRFGLAFPLGNEAWHVETAGARMRGAQDDAPSSSGGPTVDVFAGDIGKGNTAAALGVPDAAFDQFAGAVATIEGADWGQMGGSSGRFAGKFQMGAEAIADAARTLGIPAPSREEFLSNPALQRRMFDAFTATNHQTLMRDPRYAAMSPGEKLQVLGYAHNQGAGGALKWLETGVEGRDAFGTSGKRYFDFVGQRLGNPQAFPGASSLSDVMADPRKPDDIASILAGMTPTNSEARAQEPLSLETLLNDKRSASEIREAMQAADGPDDGPVLAPLPQTPGADAGALLASTAPTALTAAAAQVGTRAAPIQITSPEAVNLGAELTALPTPAQAEAGNYRKRHVKFDGLDISIETEAGQPRTGVGPDGVPWSVTMPVAYGDIKRTKGADGDPVDVYLGGEPNGRVYVIDQIDPATGKFDEHKAMLGFADEASALAAYEQAFSDGRGRARVGASNGMTQEEFRRWLSMGNTRKPVSYARPRVLGNPRRRNGGPADLVQFLAQSGGIQDYRGELGSLGMSNAFVPGAGRLVRAGGMTLDRARELAAEAGYLGAGDTVGTTSVRDLLDALDRNARGQRVFSHEDADAVAEADRKRADAEDERVRGELNDVIKESGATLRDSEKGEMLDLIAQGESVEDAFVMVIERNAQAFEDDLQAIEEKETQADERIPFDDARAEDGPRPEAAPPREQPEGPERGGQEGSAPERVEPRGGQPDQDAQETVAPAEPTGQTFQTSKGSTYTVYSDGSTVRNKAARSDVGHEGDSGIKAKSDRTLYFDSNAASLSAAGMSNLGSKGARVIVRDGKASLLTWNDAQGRWGRAPSAADIPFTTDPGEGRYPLELWDRADDVPGYEAYRRMHAGNAIVPASTSETEPVVRNLRVTDDGAQPRAENAQTAPEPAVSAKPAENIQNPSSAPATARKPAIQKTIPDTPQARRAVTLMGGAKPGDRVTPSADIGYSPAGETVTITSLTKKGNVYVSNDSGGSTSWSMADIMGATSRGTTFAREGAVVKETESMPEPQAPQAVEAVAEPEMVETESVAPGTQGSDTDATAKINAPQAGADLARTFADRFRAGERFATIAQARKVAAEVTGQPVQPGTEAAKAIDEAIELGVVIAARDLVRAGENPAATFDALLDLYERQPALNVRSSTSVADQAYSTPVPLAYVASQLAGIGPRTRVYEPTAGNGALLIAADPRRVHANELNPARAAALRAQGIGTVTKRDGSLPPDTADRFPAVIANPPFGVVKEDGRNKVFDLGQGRSTTEIDHAISLAALGAMTQDGKAVLLIAGPNKLATGEARSDAYNGKRKREFFYTLYGEYNVTDHFTVAGELYARQGAAWPIDVIVIDGRGKSARALPAVDVPRILSSWDEVKGLLDERNAEPAAGPAATVDATVDADPRRDGGRAGRIDAGREDVDGGQQPSRPERADPDTRDAGGIRDGRDRGQPARDGATRADEPTNPAARAGSDEPAAVGRPLSDARVEAPAIARTEAAAETAPALERGEQAKTKRAKPEKAEKADTSERQVAYRPKSKQNGMGTLVPVNMQTAAQDALTALQKRVGPLDDFVARELGIPADQLGRYFAAEQVDGVALGIDNFSRGAAVIIGDQTGIGKGRQVAGILRWAMRNGKTPVFVTEKPNLYADMIRDLEDVGVKEMLGRDIKPLMTNAGETVPLDDEGKRFIKTQGAGPHGTLLKRLTNAGKLDGFDIVFTTYSQLQTQRGEETDRMRFVRAMAQANGVLVFDEAHNAGGQAAGDRAPAEGAAPNRAQFVRDLLPLSDAVLYSSATYAKRPDVMDLYAKTDMRLAVEDMKDLGPLIAKGGVPMQQVVASMLSQAGQYVRRERSFDGVVYDTPTVPVDRKVYGQFSEAIKAIQSFSEEHVETAKAGIDKEIKAEAKSISADNATGGAGATSTNFTSIMHNVINQMLLSISADQAADMAIAAIRADEKPVITVANTLESFVAEYAEDNGMSVGDPIALDFSGLLLRYLERSRILTIKKPYSGKGESIRHRLTDAELGPDGVRAFRETERMIRKANFGKLPVSPVDWMLMRLRAEGFKVGEITGRTMTIDYAPDGTAKIGTRPGTEKSIAGRRRAISGFNGGTIDAMILNQAGSTGLSLHASERVNDKRRRHMIIAQAEGNIDTHMQMLGRVHRTGQVITPRYSQLVADVPAQKRPASVLAKKMASLNASTTASRDSAMTAKDVPDFINAYGDRVAVAVMKDNPDIHAELGEPLNTQRNGDFAPEDAMRKVTGRIPLLPLDQQESLYATLEGEYAALLQQVDAAGENALEAKTLELDAKTLDRKEVRPAQGSDSPFAGAVHFETVDVKRLGKPMTWAQVTEALQKSLNTTQDKALHQIGRARQVEESREVAARFADYRRSHVDTIKKDETRDAAQKRTEDNRKDWVRLHELAAIGQGVRLRSEELGTIYGVVIDVKASGKTLNPLAMSSWKVTIATADPSRQLTFGMSQLWTRGLSDPEMGSRVSIERADSIGSMSLADAFNDMQQERREERTIVTGNILAGYDFVNGRGSIVNFTDADGRLRQGILMRRDFVASDFVNAKPIRFQNADQLLTFLERAPKVGVSSADGLSIVRRLSNGDIRIETDGGRGKGGTYFLNRGVLDAAKRDFVKVGSVMRLEVPPTTALRVLDAMKTAGALYETREERDVARSVTGERTMMSLRDDSRVETIQGGDGARLETVLSDRSVEHVNALEGRLRGELDKMGLRDVAIRLADSMRLVADGTATTADGVFLRDTITIAMDAENPSVTLGHEAVHALRELGAFKDSEWRMLERRAAAVWMKRHNIAERYGAFPAWAQTEEAIAAAYEAFLKGRSNEAGAIVRFFNRMRDVLAAIRRAFLGEGFETANDVFRSIGAGRIGERPRAPRAGERAVYQKRSGDGDLFKSEVVETMNGPRRSYVEPQARADNLRAWFGASKITNADGSPKRVFHGSTRAFDEFRAGAGELGNQGIYFSADPEVANDYALGSPRGQEGANVTPVYLKVDRPLVIRGPGFIEKAKARIMGRGVDNRATQSSFLWKERVAELKAQGYDGIVNEGANEIVVFDASQIKSVNNRGTFDARDTRIMASLRDEPETTPDRTRAMSGFIARGQPLDRAIRLPFEWNRLGGLDGQGAWKPGVRINAAVERAITQARFDDDGRFAWLNPILHTARNGLVDRYGLSQEYVERDRLRANDERRIMQQGVEILKSIADSNLSVEENRVLQAMLTDKSVSNADMEKLAEPIRVAIDQLGQEAVALGLISPESYERNRGAYLNRSYMKYESELDGLGKLAGRIFGGHRKKIVGNQLKGRGMFVEVDSARLGRDNAEWIEARRGNPVKGDRFRVLDELAEQSDALDSDRPAKVVRRVYLPADQAVPAKYAGFRDSGVWEVRDVSEGGKVTIWRDYTKAERESMGEILDARYNIGKTYMQMSHDLATGRFYKDIAENEEWSRSGTDIPPEGTWREAADYGRLVNSESVEWVKVPNTAIPGTGGKKKWGALSDRFVRAEIWRDLNEVEIVRKGNFWRRLVQQWKLNKTVRNPVVHMNNVMSNLMFMDLADVRAADLVSGIMSYAKGDEAYREAVENGAFGTSMIAQELREEVLKPILADLQREMQGGAENSILARAGMLGKVLDRIRAGLVGVDQFARNAYNMEDEVFRMAAYVSHRRKGGSAYDAGRFANETFLDYDIRAPWVNVARNTVLPFISYTYRAVPVIAKALAYRPWKLAKYYAVAYAVNLLAYTLTGGDDEDDEGRRRREERERGSLREEEQGWTWIGVPRMLRMPWDAGDGRPVFLDIRRWIAAGDVFDTNQGSAAIGVPAPLQWGGPLMLAAELMLNKQAFTGEPITNDLTDDAGDKAGKVADWAWKAWMPGAFFVPGSWYWNKIRLAAIGAEERPGVAYSVPQALASSVGIKIKPQDVDSGYGFQMLDYKKTVLELKTQARDLYRQRQLKRISEEALQEGMARITEKVGRVSEKIAETNRKRGIGDDAGGEGAPIDDAEE